MASNGTSTEPSGGGPSRTSRSSLFSIAFWTAAVCLLIALAGVLGRDSGPFILGGTLAFIVAPAFAQVRRRTRLSRTLAALLVTSAVMLIMAACFAALAGPLAAELTGVANKLPDFLRVLTEQFENTLRNGFDSARGPSPEETEEAATKATETIGAASEIAIGGLATLFDTVMFLVFTPFTLMFVLRDGHRGLAVIDRALPTSMRADVRELGRTIRAQLSAYVRGQTFLCLSQAIVHIVGLSLIGLNFAILLGILTGLATAVPVIGNIVMFTVSIIIAVMQFDEIWPVVAVALVFGFSQLLETVVLSPVLVGKPIQLHPVWVILAVVIGGNVMGILGALLGLPVAATLKAILQFAAERHARGDLALSGDEDTR
ncbi:AI-2E family transporter [Minwuia sp.]|uniref:AI-2E family transporter n=1 Tax=Minwuia sp. TaxID=2493630 RepID=UPI003A91F833